jgi:hypothetical protein
MGCASKLEKYKNEAATLMKRLAWLFIQFTRNAVILVNPISMFYVIGIQVRARAYLQLF